MKKAVVKEEETTLEKLKAGDVVRLSGDEKIDDRKDDLVVVLLLNPTRARVQRVTPTSDGPRVFRAVDITPACPARKLGTIEEASFKTLVPLLEPINGKGGPQMGFTGKKAEKSAPATKAPKAAPAKAAPATRKAAAPKAESTGNGRGRPSAFTGKEKIKLLVKENPKRAGSKAHASFAKYKNGLSVADFIAAGGSMADLKYDSAHKFIELK